MMRVLIVSPHFPPTNAADMQRVRLLLPYLEENGVHAEVLCVGPEQVASPQDKWLVDGLPAGVPIHRVRAMGLGWTKLPGLGTLTFRALGALKRRGDELLAGKPGNTAGKGRGFDLVYFSTTEFGLHTLGPRWRRKYGVPFVMDYQDPWVSDYYRKHPDITPPGGRFKYGVVSWIARHQEPRVLRDCSGITSVSAAYPEQLSARYQWLTMRNDSEGTGLSSRQTLPFIVLPFPGDESDHERMKAGDIRQTVFDPKDGRRHWVYVGRGGEDMALSVRALFSALEQLRQHGATIESLRLHFIGTSYAAAGYGTKTIEPLALEYGIGEIVREHPDRIPYSETVRVLFDADLLIVPGSDDPGYTASKTYPYLLAGKPMLAIFHQQSSVCSLMQKVGGGHLVPFSNEEKPEKIAERILGVPGIKELRVPSLPLERLDFEPYTAKAQAGKLSFFFRQIVKQQSQERIE